MRKIKLIIILTLSLAIAPGVCLSAIFTVNPGESISDAVSLLSPGDELLVRGGVYRESVAVTVSGTLAERITIKNYPDETPVLDGTTIITGWVQCGDSGDCSDNPNWQSIYRLDIPISSTIVNFRLHENGRWLQIAQNPDQSEPGLEQYSEYKSMPAQSNGLTDSLVDPNLTQEDDFWNGAKVYVRTVNDGNYIRTRTIADFIQSENKIVFDKPLNAAIDSSRDSYSIANHISVLDREGEYAYEDLGNGFYRLYLWPLEEQNLTNGISMSQRSVGIMGRSYITIDGLGIRGYTGKGIELSGAHSGFIARNNTISEILGTGIQLYTGNGDIIEYNTIENIRGAFGVLTGQNTENIVVQRNTIRNTQQTAIFFSNSNTNGKILFNTIEKTGTHGNGISLWVSANIVVAGNSVFTGSSIPLTLMERSANILIYNNVFSGSYGGYNTVASWTSSLGGKIVIVNNVIHGVPERNAGLFVRGNNVVVKNNFIDGGGLGNDRSHNVFITTVWNQDAMGEGEFIERDLSLLFIDAGNLNFKIMDASLAVDKGIDITPDLPDFLDNQFFSNCNVLLDIEGNSRPAGSNWDIGPYEYGASSPEPEPDPDPQPQPEVEPEPEPDINAEADDDSIIIENTVLSARNNVIKAGSNSSMVIRCDLKKAGNLSVKIYDSKGREIIVLFDGHKETGRHEFSWSAAGVGSGIYMVNMKIGSYSKTKKIAVIK